MLSPLLSLVVLLGAQGAEGAGSRQTDAVAGDKAASADATSDSAGDGAAAEAPADDGVAEKDRILILQLSTTSPEDRTVAQTLTGLLTTEVARHRRFAALSGDDIKELMALEGQKAAMGCDDVSCLAEIAGAMGARFVVSGRLSRLDQTLVLQVNLFDAQAAEAVARSVHKASSADQMAEQLGTIADELAATAEAALSGKLEGTSVSMSEASPTPDTASEGGLPLLMVSGLAVVGAGVLLSVVAGGTGAVAYAAFSNVFGLDKGSREIARIATFAGLAGGLVGLVAIAAGGGVLGASFLVE